jgi:hypothetical protein
MSPKVRRYEESDLKRVDQIFRAHREAMGANWMDFDPSGLDEIFVLEAEGDIRMAGYSTPRRMREVRMVVDPHMPENGREKFCYFVGMNEQMNRTAVAIGDRELFCFVPQQIVGWYGRHLEYVGWRNTKEIVFRKDLDEQSSAESSKQRDQQRD